MRMLLESLDINIHRYFWPLWQLIVVVCGNH